MFPSWFYVLFIIVFDSVKVHSHGTTDETHDVTKKHVSGVAPGNGSKLLLNAKRKAKDFDEVGDSDSSVYNSGKRWKDESQNSSERDEETIDDDDNDDSSEDFKTRALQTGDLMTPVDMLPIASKLLKKVRGGGRGIVSSSKSPEALADILFGNYFLTTRRIVYVTDEDLSGLDALQALALEGEVVKMRSSGDSITEKPVQSINLNGQLVGLDPNPMRCHYKLLFKKVSTPNTVLRKGQSGGITPFNKISKLEKKMSPNRHLIINHKGRKSNKENNKANEDEVEMVKKDGEHKKYKLSKDGKKKVKNLKSKQKLQHRQNKSSLARNKKLNKQRKQRKKNRKPKFTEKLKHLRNKNIDLKNPITTTQRPVCKWRYICRTSELDTCRLHTSCIDSINNNPMLDTYYVDTKRRQNKEEEERLLLFRKMFGLTALDEEVEKILEKHVLLVKPENMRPDNQIETLSEYFNNVIMAQNALTTPIFGSDQSKKANTPHPLGAFVTDQDLLSSREDLRQIVGKKVNKMKSAPTHLHQA